MLWKSYIGEPIVYLVDICLTDQEILWTMSPLICFEIVEWHRPERVQKLHLVDRRGCHKYDWETYHAPYVALWATRVERIVTSPLMAGIMGFYDPYIEWYRCIPRRLITPPLHRDQMRYYISTATFHLLVSL